MPEEVDVALTARFEARDDSVFPIDERTRYTWNFKKFIQQRWYLFDEGDDEVWKVVKTRSIRRVKILAAPTRPL